MGIFDKVKHFVGGHGVSAKITKVERQSPEHVTFSVTDSVMKFRVEVSSEKEVQILSHLFEVYLARTTSGNEAEERIASDIVDADHQVHGAPYSMPYTLKAGETVSDGCCIVNVDIPAAIKKLGATEEQVLHGAHYRCFVRFTADVKGSPVDPKAECTVKLLPPA